MICQFEKLLRRAYKRREASGRLYCIYYWKLNETIIVLDIICIETRVARRCRGIIWNVRAITDTDQNSIRGITWQQTGDKRDNHTYPESEPDGFIHNNEF
jgi:hypothetical protein